MEFTVEVNILKEPKRFERYNEAFLCNKPLDTGTRVIKMEYYADDNATYCVFRLRS